VESKNRPARIKPNAKKNIPTINITICRYKNIIETLKKSEEIPIRTTPTNIKNMDQN
jgi:hypothetical protein